MANPESANPTPIYRLALTTFQNKEGLISSSGGAYKNTFASGDAFTAGISGGQMSQDTSQTYGEIFGTQLEGSNVDIAKVALDMNLLNRGFLRRSSSNR